MATRPTEVPEWASGASRRVKPDAGEKSNGFVQGERTPARKGNWALGLAADWVTWLAALIGSDEELTYQTPKARTTVIHAVAFQGAAGPLGGGWNASTESGGGGIKTSMKSQADFVSMYLNLGKVLPANATITRIRVLVKPGSARATSGNRVAAQLVHTTPAFTGTEAYPDETQVGTWRDDGTTDVQSIDSGVISLAVGTAGRLPLLIVSSGNDGGVHVKDTAYAVHISYDDTGPRNF